MKTQITFEQFDHIGVKRNISYEEISSQNEDTGEIDEYTIYLDKLKDGSYTVSRDDFLITQFTGNEAEAEARDYYDKERGEDIR